ncbi:MAG: hypothetical protein K8R67_17145 [Desulfobacteraceae bacterium]|nr:hypothetical protein [Desulfobacteraceae bacterium]
MGAFSQCYAQEISYKVVSEYVAEDDARRELLIVDYNENQYSRLIGYNEKIVSCKIKIINKKPFILTRFKTFIVGTAGKPFNAIMMYVLIPTVNSGINYLEQSFEQILKGWIDGEKEPDKDEFEIKITEGGSGVKLTLINKFNKNDIQLVYFYNPNEKRFLR